MYSVYLNNTSVGQAQVNREGLYYIIQCKCVFPQKDIYRIMVTDGDNNVDLGICVPDGNYFTLYSRIAVKNIPGKNLQFIAIMGRTMDFIVSNGNPFYNLDKLETARLQYKNGQLYVVID